MQLFPLDESCYTHAVRAYGALAWAYQSAAATPPISKLTGFEMFPVATLTKICNTLQFPT